VKVLQHPPEYAMTFQVLMENHIVEDRTTEVIVAHIADHTADRTAEVVVHDSSVCAGSMRNAECRIDLRTTYPTY
jgi:hypothetical protein